MSFSEQMYYAYFKTFWTSYANDYITTVEKDHSQEYLRRKFHNVSSIVKDGSEVDESANDSLGKLIQDVG